MTADRIKSLEDALRNIRELNMTGADENGHRWAHSDLIEQEIMAALAASRTASDCQQQDLVTAARVKPLVWSDDPSSALDCAWIDDFGLYQITDEDVLFIGHNCIGTAHETTEAAKAAAQANYEARILSALDLTPPTAQDAARVPEIAEDHGPISVGDIGNYYGGLWLKRDGGKDFWCIENFNGMDWSDCPADVADALRAIKEVE